MAKTIVAVNTSADTFQVLIDRVNEVINAVSTEVVTANTNANGAVTTGNTYLIGIFAANTVAVEYTLRGGNVQSSANLNISSNVVLSEYLHVGNTTIYSTVNSTVLVVGNSKVNTSTLSTGNSTVNSIINSSSLSFNSPTGNSVININVVEAIENISLVSNTITGTSATLVDSFLISDSRTVDYTYSITDHTANNYKAGKLLIMQDTGDALLTEYGKLISNTDIGEFTANANSSAVRLYFTPTSSNTTVKLYKLAIGV